MTRETGTTAGSVLASAGFLALGPSVAALAVVGINSVLNPGFSLVLAYVALGFGLGLVVLVIATALMISRRIWSKSDVELGRARVTSASTVSIAWFASWLLVPIGLYLEGAVWGSRSGVDLSTSYGSLLLISAPVLLLLIASTFLFSFAAFRRPVTRRSDDWDQANW